MCFVGSASAINRVVYCVVCVCGGVYVCDVSAGETMSKVWHYVEPFSLLYCNLLNLIK